MKTFVLLAAYLLGASAYPFVMNDIAVEKRLTPIQISQAEGNCGPVPCTTFDPEDQYVSTSGQYAYQSPSASDIRGPCPGLNAAANHGYIPRTGILHIDETANGLAAAYNLAQSFSYILAVYSIVMTGDVASLTWSIGGPLPTLLSIPGVTYPPQGISYSHNKYEGDVSIGRNDAYQNNGDAHSLNVTRFRIAYETGMDDDRYTLHKFREAFGDNLQESISNNPYYFSPPFAGTIVPPAAYNFVINFMSNHTADNPNGYLDGSMFKQFFAVSGDYPNFVWNKGQERIPDNWYKRPTVNQYDAETTVGDDAIGWAAYPENFRIGGNTNGVNTYKGVDIASLTGGTYTNDNILTGNNFACLAFQSEQQALPDFLKGGVNDIAASLALFNKYTNPLLSQLGCPGLAAYDTSLFNQYPGHTYNPTGTDNNY